MTGRNADSPELSPVEIPITGELDLHTFDPRDLGQLIPAYLEACAARIVHGKGTGTLRTTLHALLHRSPWVVGFRTADSHAGSWGATLATLRP